MKRGCMFGGNHFELIGSKMLLPDKNPPLQFARLTRDEPKAKALSEIAGRLAVAVWLMAINTVLAQGGIEAWVQRYAHPTNSSAVGRKVATDNAGNVIVAGYSGSNFLVLKYSNAGVPVWTNLYTDPVGGMDEATALAVDGSGNVFVTGYSADSVQWQYNPLRESPFEYDYTTIKYSSAGIPIWTNRLSATPVAYPSGIALDANGNVFVTGRASRAKVFVSDYIVYLYDSVTVAYSAQGHGLWGRSYSSALPSAIAVDANGNVVVTGSYYTTIKYSGAGVPLWTNRYNGFGVGVHDATAVAVDISGNVFITGRSDNQNYYSDYATLAYSALGVPLWTNRHNGTTNGNDGATAIGLDPEGNVFVTGTSATIKYSNAGIPLWTNRFSGFNLAGQASALVADGSGNVFVTGRLGSDYATIGYSSAGVRLWINRYNGNWGDEAQSVAVDRAGNVFVTGQSATLGTWPWNYDCVTIKYAGPTRLTAQAVGGAIILQWSNPASALQAAPTLTGTYTNIPGATSPYTNAVSSPQLFFRLVGN